MVNRCKVSIESKFTSDMANILTLNVGLTSRSQFLQDVTDKLGVKACRHTSFLFSVDSKTEEQTVSAESLRESLKKELEFYFSR